MKINNMGIAALLTLVAGCGDAGTSTTAVADSPQDIASESVPDGESVSGSIGGETFEATTIRDCRAVPGIALGFNASTEDYVGPGQGAGLRIGGGVERDRARLVADYRGERWTAGEGVDGAPVEFTLTDARSETRQFVTLQARGQLVNEGGLRIPIEVVATCEPGGT